MKPSRIAILKTIAFVAVVPICISAQTTQSSQSIKIGEIEFFGVGDSNRRDVAKKAQSGKLKARNNRKKFSRENLEQLRRALPVKEGDDFRFDSGQATMAQVKQVIRHTTGRDATDVNFLCCDDRGAAMIFIGLPGSTYRPFKYNSVPASSPNRRMDPSANPQLPAEIIALVERTGDLAGEAAQREAREDRSQGYALSLYPPFREVQLKIREYALDHAGLLHRVLFMSSDAKQRRAAAYALGYAPRTDAQLASLAWASRDSSSAVRNDATRALAVLAQSDPRAAARIPTAHFVAMLSSGSWSDRNKAAWLLAVLTAKRKPTLLTALRKNALGALIEIAHWRNTGHAFHARMIVGRVAGIEETQLQKLASGEGSAEEIVGRLRRPHRAVSSER
jgi:hypothetical protein